jgi:hypothetical protein
MEIRIMPLSYKSLSGSSSTVAQSITCAANTGYYQSAVSLDAGIYTITCTSSTNATVDFYTNPTTLLASATTVTGSITVNIASAVTKIGVYINTGTNVTVNIQLIGQALPGTAASGTLDTLTTNQTYTQTGNAYVVVIGGGGGGGNGSNSWYAGGGGGGGSGGVTTSQYTLTGDIAVTIGSGGAVSTSGTSTIFGTITSTGGGGGGSASSGAAGSAGAAGTPNGGAGGAGGASSVGANGTASITIPSFIVSGNTGGGGGGQGNGPASGYGAGSSAGTISYGRGGAGGQGGGPTAGSVGSNGVVYVLRGL